MTISATMNAGLGFLQDINSQMEKVQGRLSTGKKDLGVVQLLTVTDFQNRVSSLNTVNDGIITGLAQFKAASTAITSIRSSLSDTLNAMRDARTSAAKSVSGSTQPDTESPAGAAFTLNFEAATSGGTFNGNSLLTNVRINGQTLSVGNALAIRIGTKEINLQVGTAAQAAAGSDSTILNATNALNSAISDLEAKTTAKNTAQTNSDNAAAVIAGQNVTATTTITGVDNAVIKGALAYYGSATTAATQVTQQQLADFMFKVNQGTINFGNGTDASSGVASNNSPSGASIASVQAALASSGAGTVQQQVALVNGGIAAMTGGIKGYYNTLLPLKNAVTAFTAATNAKAAAQTALDAANLAKPTGDADKPFIVATVQDYLTALTKLNNAEDGNRIQFDQTPGLTGNLTSFTTTGQADSSISITSTISSSTIAALFQKKFDAAAPTDKTNAYETASWSTSGNTNTLTQKHHTGTGAGSTTSAADAKRAVAANSFRSFLDQMKQLVKDSRVNGVNILNGENVNITVNADGDKFNFQLTNAAGTAGQSLVDSLGINPADFNLVAGGVKSDGTPSVKNDFDNNVDLDAAITAMNTALAKVDITKSNIATAQTTLQNRSDFNSALVKIFNNASIGIQSNDSTADAAELASLQSRQQFANSILSIIKQGDQNPLQLLR